MNFPFHFLIHLKLGLRQFICIALPSVSLYTLITITRVNLHWFRWIFFKCVESCVSHGENLSWIGSVEIWAKKWSKWSENLENYDSYRKNADDQYYREFCCRQYCLWDGSASSSSCTVRVNKLLVESGPPRSFRMGSCR